MLHNPISMQPLLFCITSAIAVSLSVSISSAAASSMHEQIRADAASFAAIFVESFSYSVYNETHGSVRVAATVTTGFYFLASHLPSEQADWNMTCDDVLLIAAEPGQQQGRERCHDSPASLPPTTTSKPTCRAPVSAHCSHIPSFHNGQSVSSSCFFQSSDTHHRLWSFWLENPLPSASSSTLNAQVSVYLHLNCRSSLGSIAITSLPFLHAISPSPPNPPHPKLSFPPMLVGKFGTESSASWPEVTHVHPLFPKAFQYLKSFNQSTPDGQCAPPPDPSSPCSCTFDES
jgi:hypothetical protein